MRTMRSPPTRDNPGTIPRLIILDIICSIGGAGTRRQSEESPAIGHRGRPCDPCNHKMDNKLPIAAFLPFGQVARTGNVVRMIKWGSRSTTVEPLRHAAVRGGCALLLTVTAASSACAQSPEIDELKGKIFDAHMAQKTFSGLKYCSDLDGKSFYFQLRNRILNLEEYFRSLEALVKA